MLMVVPLSMSPTSLLIEIDMLLEHLTAILHCVVCYSGVSSLKEYRTQYDQCWTSISVI